MVQVRHREVSTQRSDERVKHEAEVSRTRDAFENELSSMRGAHTAILRSELVLLESIISRSRAAAATAAFAVSLRSRLRARLRWGVDCWLRTTTQHTLVEVRMLRTNPAGHPVTGRLSAHSSTLPARWQLQRSAASKAAAQQAAVALRNARLCDATRRAISIDEGLGRLSDLSYACRKWRLAVRAAHERQQSASPRASSVPLACSPNAPARPDLRRS